MTPSTVYVCESQPILLEGLRSVLGRTEEFRLVGSASTTLTALGEITGLKPRLVLVDQGTGWREVHQFVVELRQQSPESKPIVWGADLTTSDCYRALQAGVRGVFRRTLPINSLLDCLREVAEGQVWMSTGEEKLWPEPHPPAGGLRLTPRERDIVRLVARGMKNREIAEQLTITTGTVKVHLMHVFEKTGVKDRYELAVQSRGLLGEKPALG